MPKMKTKKAAAKRFKKTGTGKVVCYKANQRHLLGHESAKVKRRRSGTTEVAASQMKKIDKMLPNLK
jgi:large subunit ribosomal protein L35